MNAVVTRNTKAGRIDRAISFARRDNLQLVAIVTEVTHLKTKSNATQTYYSLTQIPAAFGTAYRINKLYAGGESYDVHNGEHGMECDCPAGTFHGKCKHAEIVKQAVAECKL